MTIHDDPIIKDFTSLIKSKIGIKLKRIILFGSRARGDTGEGSDYDIAIIVNHRDRRIESDILDAAVAILDQYDALVSAQIFDEKEWESESELPLGLIINRQGILILSDCSQID